MTGSKTISNLQSVLEITNTFIIKWNINAKRSSALEFSSDIFPHFIFLFCSTWGCDVEKSLGMNVLLWLIYDEAFLSCSYSSLSFSFSCGFSGPGHHCRQKEGTTINRNWTNYKADVPLYDGRRALSDGECLCYVHNLSLLSFFVLVFLSGFVLTVWFSRCLAFFFPYFIREFLIKPFLHYCFI